MRRWRTRADGNSAVDDCISAVGIGIGVAVAIAIGACGKASLDRLSLDR
jgi:hypothetical protein